MLRSIAPEQLLNYCRIDNDDPLAQVAMGVAEAKEEYLERQGISLNERTKGRYGLCVMAWTLHELDHPGEETPLGVRQMINDLRFVM